MKIEEKKILKFNNDYVPMYWPPKKDGYYMTIRCGLGGIYTHLNEWKNGSWMSEATDASITIAYSKEQISKEELEEWYKNIMKKYGN